MWSLAVKGPLSCFTTLLTWINKASGPGLALQIAEVTQARRKSASSGQLPSQARGQSDCISITSSVQNCDWVKSCSNLEGFKTVKRWTKNSLGLHRRVGQFVAVNSVITSTRLAFFLSTPWMSSFWPNDMTMKTNESNSLWSFFANSSATSLIWLLFSLRRTCTSKKRDVNRSVSCFSSSTKSGMLFIRRQIPRTRCGLLIPCTSCGHGRILYWLSRDISEEHYQEILILRTKQPKDK